MHGLARRLTPQAPHVERGQAAECGIATSVRQRGPASQFRLDSREDRQLGLSVPKELSIDVDLRQHPDHPTGPAGALECPGWRNAEHVAPCGQATTSIEQGLQARVHKPTLPLNIVLLGAAVDSDSTCGQWPGSYQSVVRARQSWCSPIN